jgi:ribonucleoside-diphosphate reductase alpha chain
MELSENAQKIFKELYCFQNETIPEAFKRVAAEFANKTTDEKTAYSLLTNNIWRPNTPVFLNAGTSHKIFSACYVVGLEDSMENIYEVANVARKIFQHGAGIGIPIGNLREAEAYIYEGEPDKAPEGKSSGPITFMKLYDSVGETTKSGGRVRRAAILCSLPVWHPDIMDFIECKRVDGRLQNMNISVLVTDKFMQSLEDNTPFDLITPQDGSKRGELNPYDIWDKLAENAHASAEPGVIFIDTVNKYNPLIKDIMINCTNPCGEQPLLPFGCCNLSAINLYKFVRPNGDYDWDGLYKTTKKVMFLMDTIIDKMDYPDERFKENTFKYRPVGIGPMGLADTLFGLNLPYDGPTGRKFAARCMQTMTTACAEASAELARENGPFHNFDLYKEDVLRIINEHTGANKHVMRLVQAHGVRNCQFTTAQPTGTTALSCDASYGIEPAMGLVFQKNLISGEKMIVANPIFHRKFSRETWYDQELIDKIFNNSGSLKGIHGIPRKVRETFVVAHDILYKSRIDMQAAIQQFCSTAISSTVNLPKETTKEEISDLFVYAFEKGLKGVTIYRDGSKKGQPITFKKEDTTKDWVRPNRLHSETFTVETGNGKMYVTVSDKDGDPVEVFLNLGKSGQILNTFTEGLGRIISLALQQNVPLIKVIKTLSGINSDTVAWHRFEDTDARPAQILSIPDGIAKLLDKYYLNKEDKIIENGHSTEICPKCGQQMVATEGCFACSCGYSKCS